MKQFIVVCIMLPALSWGQAPLGDANCDGSVNIADAVFLINHVFKGGPAPACPYEIPILATAEVSAVTQTTAQCGGTIMSDGRATVTARGVCWSTNLTPTVADSKTTDGAGAGSFVSYITGLTANTPYYVRAYATNSAGTGYGMTMAFTSLPAVLPVVTTAPVTAITETTAECGGDITFDGGAPVTARGVCWGSNPNPTVADNYSSDGAGAGSFTGPITGLTSGTIYYVRAYATNTAGTGYGDDLSFKTSQETGSVTDIDGNVYPTIKIGNQWWMAENLKVTHYSNGDVVPSIIQGTTWSGLSTGAYCEYNNDVNNVLTYGRLYNWYAVNDSRDLAPAGWHVASDAEWQILVDYLGGNAVAGGKLKEIGTTHWASPNTGATNESGYSALPGGFREVDGSYHDMGQYTTFWFSTEYNGSDAWSLIFGFNSSGVIDRRPQDKRRGFSVRCIKD